MWIPVDGSNLRLERKYFDSYKTLSSYTEKASDITNFQNSVNSKGGFYVSRYEAGIPETMTEAIGNLSARNVQGKPVTKRGAIPWNKINITNAKINAESFSDNPNYKSSMINSYAWDTIITWIMNTNDDINTYEVSTSSDSWGNYAYTTVPGITRYSADFGVTWNDSEGTTKANGSSWVLLCGNTSYSQRNHIYDIAGGMYEWTTEIYMRTDSYAGNYCVIRGGSCRAGSGGAARD